LLHTKIPVNQLVIGSIATAGASKINTLAVLRGVFYCLARDTARHMIVKLRYLALSDTCSQRLYLQRARLCASLLTSVIGAFCIVFIGNCPNCGLRYALLQWKTLLMLGCCLSATPHTLIFERSKLRYIL